MCDSNCHQHTVFRYRHCNYLRGRRFVRVTFGERGEIERHAHVATLINIDERRINAVSSQISANAAIPPSRVTRPGRISAFIRCEHLE